MTRCLFALIYLVSLYALQPFFSMLLNFMKCCNGQHRLESHSNEDRQHCHLPLHRHLPGSLGSGGLFNLTCRCRCTGSRPLPVSVHPCLPLSSPPLPPTAADAPGISSPSAAALAVPLPPSPTHCSSFHCHAVLHLESQSSTPQPPPPQMTPTRMEILFIL